MTLHYSDFRIDKIQLNSPELTEKEKIFIKIEVDWLKLVQYFNNIVS